ncbi:MAG TPA: SRPBCC domain-containing protein [Dokdonella sp.]
MARIGVGLAVLALCASGLAQAEVEQAAADGFFIRMSAPVEARPDAAWAALIQPSQWWSSEHTWSGKAANLRLEASAGGCWCERWADGSAEHGRVVMAMPGKMLRLQAALGPLQEFALNAVLTFWIRDGDDGARRLELEYRVNGASASGLDAFAPKVDDVLALQFERLQRYLASGDPEPPPAPPPPAAGVDSEAARRAAIIEEWRRSAEEAAKKAKDAPPQPKHTQ